MALRKRRQNTRRASISVAMFYVVMSLMAAYFVYAAVQGPSGILRRVQIVAETQSLQGELDRLADEVNKMTNLTHRLSDDYLDLDLLDERARSQLGMVRADEAQIR